MRLFKRKPENRQTVVQITIDGRVIADVVARELLRRSKTSAVRFS